MGYVCKPLSKVNDAIVISLVIISIDVMVDCFALQMNQPFGLSSRSGTKEIGSVITNTSIYHRVSI